MSQSSSYLHGHHPSVLRSHTWRTASNSCPYLIPHITPNARILDVGCGPGTITCDLGKLAPQGSVIGVDASADVLEGARKFVSEHGVQNVSFMTGDIYDLQFPDGSFDIVHVHQVLQHITDPVRGLRELRRVTKSGGIVACREVDYAATVWYPESPGLSEWQDLYERVAREQGGDPDIGRRLQAVAREAGFQRGDMTTSVGTWCFSTPEELDFWCGMWADRTLNSEFKKKVINGGHADEAELERLAACWTAFAKEEDGWLTMLHGQIICRV
ncbi:UbiE/COQ5 family methyltransferase [Glonium stellatum]|uniref:UbiE/COQ5 family methyltransferase n=1 Tax=Glonium stellatum TaxID=574774 RepID=A0A8E2F3Q7_9PEZI|nr:UbiE/COQ5 family methyltransferase [Glonium stellatum]